MADNVRNKTLGAMLGNEGDVFLDIDNAVLLDGVNVCLVNAMSNVVDKTQRGATQSVRLAIELHGRVNKTPDRANVLFVMDEDGAAAIISELLALATRIGPEFATRLMDRITKLQEEGHVGDQ